MRLVQDDAGLGPRRAGAPRGGIVDDDPAVGWNGRADHLDPRGRIDHVDLALPIKKLERCVRWSSYPDPVPLLCLLGLMNSSEANHRRIGRAIDEANEGLQLATKMDWHLSSARFYQMSNRFRGLGNFVRSGYLIALVYLGFSTELLLCPSFVRPCNPCNASYTRLLAC